MPYFHFTLGPVQSFVSQARRTRDFWSGSFLLSWLSGVAMAATEALDGTIEFPIPPAGYLKRICGQGDLSFRPRIGAIPNRFMAKIPEAFGPGQAAQVAEAVRQAWMALAWQVWNFDGLCELAEADAMLKLWERQHQNFWEIAWVITQDKTDSAALDRRKNWRKDLPLPEPGVKCHLMEGLQELSGIEEMKKDDNERRRAFWAKLRDSVDKGEIDLTEKEMLCAVAYVKRRFVRVFDEFDKKIELCDGKKLNIKGWKLDPNMPSVSYMAAVHWVKALVLDANPGELAALHDLAVKAGAGRDEWDTRILCLDEAVKKSLAKADKEDARRCIALDGNVFFKHVQESPKSYGLKELETRKVGHWLREFWDSRTGTEPSLSPFYAVLMMDGDSLGKHMSEEANQTPIAEALNAFTEAKAVPKIVSDHNGVLIYAGGDDVLALLPLEDALDCAVELRKKYTDCFESSGIPTTLSGAIIYAHVKTALGEVLHEAHAVLDDVAKDGAGRDAIAVRVLKPGGEHLTWAQPWQIAMPEGKQQLEVVRLAGEFRKAESKNPGDFSSKFFYKMRARFEMLADMKRKEIENLLAADYLASEPARGQDGKKISLDQAREFVRPLLDQCRPAQRDPDKSNNPCRWKRGPASADAALLVRFLANKGVEANR
ncbi:MAG: type III-B CRISPR-associated protein Cas10/Cmr2 [Methylococcaceae bacterium]|nr:type III-B CRISPR-associated protein Cas10/Cmr2 [Methylococcaceae bacterium]